MFAPVKDQRQLSGEWTEFGKVASCIGTAIVAYWLGLWFLGLDVPFGWPIWQIGPLFVVVSASAYRYLRSKEVVLTQNGFLIGSRFLFWVKWKVLPYEDIESVTLNQIFTGTLNINLVRETEFGRKLSFMPGWKSAWPHTKVMDEITGQLLWWANHRRNQIERKTERKTLNLL